MRYSQISAFRALPCPALVFAQACQSLTAYGSCAHWARAPSRPKLRSTGALRAVLDLGSLRSPAGKKLFIARFGKREFAMSRTMELDSFHRLLERARAHSFPLSKRARLFPSAAYRRSASPQVALGRLNQCKLGYCIAAWMTSWCRKTGLFFLLRSTLSIHK